MELSVSSLPPLPVRLEHRLFARRSLAPNQCGPCEFLSHTVMWRFIFEKVPADRDVLLAVLDHEAFHVLEFPCRLTDDGRWINATTGRAVDVHPTHWRVWSADVD